MTWDAPADRGNKLTRDKGLGHQSAGPAGNVVSLRDVPRDIRATVAAMLARGLHRDQVAASTGVRLSVVRLIEATMR